MDVTMTEVPAKKARLDRPARANIFYSSTNASQLTQPLLEAFMKNDIQVLSTRPSSKKNWVYYGQICIPRTEDQKKIQQLNGQLVEGRELMAKILPPLGENELDALDECILYVTNIDGKSTEEKFKELFPSALNVLMPEKKGVKRGDAYVEFASKAEVDLYINEIQGVELDDRKLKLQTYDSSVNTDVNVSTTKKVNKVKDFPPDKSKVLFVGNLSFSTTEETVKNYFPLCKDVRILRSADTGQSKGHGFIDFASEEDAEMTLNTMKFAQIDGRKLSLDRASKHSEKSDRPKSKYLFMGNLAFHTTEADLKKYFPKAENVRVLTGSDGRSKGIGFVDFNSIESAEDALYEMKDIMINGKELLLDYAKEKNTPAAETRNQSKTLFVGNLNFDTTEKKLREEFPKCSDLRLLMSTETGRSKGMAFIDFRTQAAADAALKECHGKQIDGREIIVNYSDTTETLHNPKYRVLFIANLNPQTTEGKLMSKFPRCLDARIPNSSNKMKKSGFIDFRDVRDAELALKKMNNTVIDGSRIVLNYAKDRGDRNYDGPGRFGNEFMPAWQGDMMMGGPRGNMMMREGDHMPPLMGSRKRGFFDGPQGGRFPNPGLGIMPGQDMMQGPGMLRGQGMMGQDMMGQEMMGRGQGMMGRGQGMMGRGQGMMGRGQGRMGQGQGMMGQGQGMMGQGQGMMGQGQGMMGQGQGMMGQGQGMMGQGQGMMGQGQGMIGPGLLPRPDMQGMSGSGPSNDDEATKLGTLAKMANMLGLSHILPSGNMGPGNAAGSRNGQSSRPPFGDYQGGYKRKKHN